MVAGRGFAFIVSSCHGPQILHGDARIATRAEDIARHTIKACSDPFFSTGQFGSPIWFAADRRKINALEFA